MSIINFANPIDDTIEFTSADTINFGTEFIAANIIFKQQGNNLLIKYIDPLVHNSELDPKSITLTNVSLDDFFNGNLQGNQFVFENGSEVIFPDESGILQRNSENDLLIGGSGPNIIYGGNGDVLDGGSGVNTYEFSLDSGINCIIQNTSNTFQSYSPDNTPPDTIDFSNVYSTDITNLYQSGTDLIICYGTNNQVTVTNFYSTSLNQIGQIQFADGSSWGSDFIQNTNFIFDTTNDSLTLTGSNIQSNYISAGLGADILIGGSGDTTINNTFIAGTNNDTLEGGAGLHTTNTYVFSSNSLHYNQTIIQNTTSSNSSSDKVIFSNINSDSITGWSQEVNTDNLILTVALGSNSSSITIDNFYADSNAISTLQFADTVWTVDFIKNTNYYNGINITGDITISDVNNSKNDYYIGSNGSDNFTGSQGNDFLSGGTLDSTLIGNTGNDTLQGGAGVNTYQFALGDGTDTIIQTAGSALSDTIVFTDVKSTDITNMQLDGSGNLVISYGTSDQITVNNFYDSSINRIAQIQFSDNVSWTSEYIQSTNFDFTSSLNSQNAGAQYSKPTDPQYLVGNSGDQTLLGGTANDTIIAGTGNDTIEGFEGDNLYVFSRGNYQDTISQNTTNDSSFVDTIRFNDIESESVTWIKTGNDLIINFGLSSVTVQNFYDPTVNFVGLFQFSDTTLGVEDVNRKIITYGTDGSDSITGLDGTNNIIYGLSDNDIITGGNQANTIVGGQGDDVLNGGTGDGSHFRESTTGDTYIFSSGDGIDIINPNANYIDTLLFTNVKSNDVKATQEGNNLVINYGVNLSDSILINNYFVEHTQKFQFADLSSPWSYSDLIHHIAPTFTEFSPSNIVGGLGGNPSYINGISTVASGNEDTSIAITFDNLLSNSNATDNFGTVTSFKITSVTSGTLLIGADSTSATAWDETNNNTVDATHIAYWTPPTLTVGSLGSFKAVAVANGNESLTSVQAYVDVNHVNHAPTGDVLISGTPNEYQTLTASNTLSDIDGLGTISYQWLADGQAISGANGATLSLSQNQVGKAISVQASYTDLLGAQESVISSATASASHVNTLPTGGVIITGNAIQYDVLTANTSTLADQDGLGALNYQWYANGTAISNATSNTYSLTQAEVGKAITVQVSYTDLQNTSESATSLATATVQNVNDLPTGGVVITGDAIQYGLLTADTSSLDDLDGLGTLSYQWFSDGTAISNATSNTYSLTQAEVGKAISVAVSYVDGFGQTETVNSLDNGGFLIHGAGVNVTNVNDLPTGGVTINGDAIQYGVITADTSTLADLDGLGIISYQWLADGHAINGANGATLSLSQNQVGKAISVQASYTDLLGTQESVTSADTPSVAPAPIDPINDRTHGLEYIATYGDLINAFGTNANAGISHYITYGHNEHRTVMFNGLEYIASYGDLIKAFGANIDAGSTHFITYGYNEHRSVTFNALEYIASYGDLIKAFGANIDAGSTHFITYGHNEHRTVTFDALEYIASYGDLIKAFGANADAGSTHFINYGYNEHRTVTFDALEYIASYGDLINAFSDNADAGSAHYITYGINEHRATNGFNVVQYLNNYADLKTQFGTDYQAAIDNYITTGYKAGLTDALISTAGNDTLTGGNGDNIINGGLGNDVLTGGSGVNKFVFDTTPNATTNLDTITNFVAGKDQIELSHSVFTALGQQGVLSADQFVAGDFNSGQTATNHIIYNSTSGGVYYDADGSGNSAAVEIAVVGTNLNLTAGDIHII